MRKLMYLIAAAGLVLGLASSATAGVLVPHATTLSIRLAGLPSISVVATPGTESLVQLGDGSLLGPSTGHFIGAQSSVWSTINLGPGTSLFTGVPLISNLKATVMNQAGVLQDGFSVPAPNGNIIGGGHAVGPNFGGIMRLSGSTFLTILGNPQFLQTTLTNIGGPIGGTTMQTLIGNNLSVTAMPWFTAPVKITGITTNIVTIPGRGNLQGVPLTLQPTTMESVMTLSTNGGFVSISGGGALEAAMVTLTGTNNLLSGSKPGMVTVVSPTRINVDLIQLTLPAAGVAKFTFVPEPGTMLLLISGAVGLAVIGRRRMRK